jgi:hypothetical protein
MKKFKYAPNSKKPNSRVGRKQDPNSWKHGPDPFVHESYYAYLKHRSQANFRGEEYELTFEDWHSQWTEETFAQRGRAIDSLVLTRVDWEAAWELDNIQVVEKSQHLKLAGKHRRKKNDRAA